MKVFATRDRERLQRKSRRRRSAASPALLGGTGRRAVQEMLYGPSGHNEPSADGMAPRSDLRARMRVRSPGFAAERTVDPHGQTAVALPCRLDHEEVNKPAAKNVHQKEPPLPIEHPEGREGHPPKTHACWYRAVTLSHDEGWQDFPRTSGGGRTMGAFVSSHSAWVAGNGIMKHRFLVTVDVDGDPRLCPYRQENENYLVRHEGQPNELVDLHQARHNDTPRPAGGMTRFTDSQIQWMDAPGYPANLDTADPPVHQQWTFWWSAWNSDGTGPLELELSYDFKAPDAGYHWSLGCTPSVPASVST